MARGSRTTACPLYALGLDDDGTSNVTGARTISAVQTNTAANTHAAAETHAGNETHSGDESHTGKESFVEYQQGASAGGDGYKEFKTAMASGGALASGDLVMFDPTLSTATSYRVLASSTTAQDARIIGVATETIASASFGEIQIYGHNTTVKVDGTTTSVAIGDQIAGGIVAKKASKLEYANRSATLGGISLGTCMATVASGSDETFACFIDPR